MKKIVLFFLFAVLITSCKPKEKIVGTGVDNKTERIIKGFWAISSVTYPGQEYIKVTSFDIADSKCFVGSKWKFVTNNNKGNILLTNSSCIAFNSPTTFYFNKDGNFVMKILNGSKSRKVTEGYILSFANVSENSFQLIDKINVGGKVIDVVYQFNRD